MHVLVNQMAHLDIQFILLLGLRHNVSVVLFVPRALMLATL
jgi:hypothetical protein